MKKIHHNDPKKFVPPSCLNVKSLKTHRRFKKSSQGIFKNIVSKAFKGVPQIHDLFNVDLHNNYHQPILII
jgi:hypothetical protein